MAALVCSPALPTLTSQVTIYGWSTSAWADLPSAATRGKYTVVELDDRVVPRGLTKYPQGV